MSKYKDFKGISPTLIAAEANVTQTTLYRWAKRDDKEEAYKHENIKAAIENLLAYTTPSPDLSEREDIGFSADKIAAEARVSRATVFNWKKGKASLSSLKIDAAVERLKEQELITQTTNQ